MTNREQIWVVLLSALIDIGGEGSKQTVLEYIQQNGFWYQNDSNRTNPPSRPTEYSWRNDISYGRQHMVERGCMLNERRDLWKISEKGRLFFEELSQKLIDGYPFAGMQFTEAFYRHLLNREPSTEEAADRRLIEQVTLLDEEVCTPVPPVDPPKPKGRHVMRGTQKHYRRDPNVSKNALLLAGYRCEIDSEHTSFLCRSKQHLYMEPHHLIPMAMTDRFDVSLDREQNIFCLCSNCHNRIHYGTREDVREMIRKLFGVRSEKICAILDCEITEEELFSMYRV